MLKKYLDDLESLRKETKSLSERINKIKNKPQKILIDGVRGSSKTFPYIQHTYRIERVRQQYYI